MQRVEAEIARLIEEIEYSEVSRLFGMLQGGKRLRAKLILKIAPHHKDAPLLAAIVELIHAASLLHDDVIDEAQTRRGVVSVNASEDSKTAVMLGDILYSKAFSELLRFESEIAFTIASSVTALSKGEMMDVKMAQSFNADANVYLDMLYLKTATLIEAAAKASALLAQKDASTYALYGRNLGLSFQIIDDILDITSTQEVLGKPALNDFVEGKCTLPYIYLHQSLQSEEQERLRSLHAKILSKEESQWIQSKMQEHNSVGQAYAYAQKLSNDAKELLKNDLELVSILDAMMQRSF